MSAADQIAELDQVEERHRRHKQRRNTIVQRAAAKKAAEGSSSAARTHADTTAPHPNNVGRPVDHGGGGGGDDHWGEGDPSLSASLKTAEEAAAFAGLQEVGPGKTGYYFVTRDSQGRVETSTEEGVAPAAAAAAPPAAPPAGGGGSPEDAQRFKAMTKQASWRKERAAPSRATFSAPRKRSKAITELQSQLLQARVPFHYPRCSSRTPWCGSYEVVGST